MNQAVLFIGIVVILSLAALAVALFPLLKRNSPVGPPPSDALSLAKHDLNELLCQRAQGQISEDEFKNEEAILILRLASESGPPPQRALKSYGRTLFLCLGVLGFGLTVLGYLWLGNPQGLFPEKTAPSAISPQKLQAFIDEMKTKIDQNPKDAEAIALLARAYAFQRNVDEAERMFDRALKLTPDNADLLADAVDFRVGEAKGVFDQDSVLMLNRALEKNPHHLKALALRGTEAFKRGAYASAIADWTLALPTASAQAPEWVEELLQNIEEANSKGGGHLLKPADLNTLRAKFTPIVLLQGQVELDPALRAELTGEERVFVYVRAESGPPMPLAVLRLQVKDLPTAFRFTDRDSLQDNRKLSSVNALVVSARVSRSGSATPSIGDFEADPASTVLGATGLHIQIQKTVR